jgi:hypothetical protein
MIASVLLLVDEAVLLHDLLLHRRVVHDLGLGQLGQQLTGGQDSACHYYETPNPDFVSAFNIDLKRQSWTFDQKRKKKFQKKDSTSVVE